jgi:hypothetical protein
VLFQVPQFIDTEDKIVGPLTVRQFIYVCAALGLSAILFFSVPTPVWIILSILILGLAAALAFVKINGQPFIKILTSSLSFYWRPHTYVWQAEQMPSTMSRPEEERRQGFSINNVVSGFALKSAWRSIQTGTTKKKPEEAAAVNAQERYQLFSHVTGEHTAAKRIDYR